MACGQRDQVAIYGQESNATTQRLAVMNLAIRGISADFGPEHAFEEEFIAMLERHKFTYDLRYVFEQEVIE